MTLTTILFYGTPLAAIWIFYLLLRRRREKRNLRHHGESLEAGLTEPASLHPVIDPGICIGCGACVSACPEGEVLGLIGGKAELINPTQCIGHGACKAACPMDAIWRITSSTRRDRRHDQ